MDNKKRIEENLQNGKKINRYGITKKSLYSILGLLVCFTLIIILSITQATFNKDLIKSISFWIDFSIMAGLSIYGMITGQQMGDDMSRNSPNGSYRKTVQKYLKTYNKINDALLFAYFDEWLEIYREKKIKKKIENYLIDNGINQLEVLDLDIKEIDNLRNTYKKEWIDTGYEGKYKNNITYFKSYTEEQIEVIKECLSGKIKVSKLPRSFFVEVTAISERDMWESAVKSNVKKTTYLGSSYVYKILGLLFTSIISAGLEPSLSDNTSSADIWLSLGKKIFITVMAFVWGIYIGYEIVKIDRSYLEFKEDILNQYDSEIQLKKFIPHSIEEIAKKEYEEVVINGRNNNHTKEENSEDREKDILD